MLYSSVYELLQYSHDSKKSLKIQSKIQNSKNHFEHKMKYFLLYIVFTPINKLRWPLCYIMKKQNITFNEELYVKNIAYYVGFRCTFLFEGVIAVNHRIKN